jgi:Mg-chelatase subunit ChlD
MLRNTFARIAQLMENFLSRLSALRGYFRKTASLILLLPLAVCAQPAQEHIDVVFVLDTTGSMSSLIDGAKRKVWSIANTIVDQNPNARVRIGLVGYRDRGDVYVTRSYPLSTDIQDIYGKLLKFQADGGGDTPESVNEALDVAVRKQDWTQRKGNATRILFLVGDAPPHMDYKDDRKYPEVIRDARQRGIVVNTVLAGNMEETRTIWQEIARLGAGEFMAIPQDGGELIVIETPYDAEIATLQERLNATVLPYGGKSEQSEVVRKVDAYEAASPSVAADMSRYVNKSGKGKTVITGAGDLVSDVNKNPAKLAGIPSSELPQAMQKMSLREKEHYIAARTRDRDVLSQQQAEKIRQRDAYLREAQSRLSAKGAGEDSFDAAVSRTLKKQIGELRAEEASRGDAGTGTR